MPLGTGAEELTTVPDLPFVVDPNAFMRLTKKNVHTAKKFTTPGPGEFREEQLPQVGVVSKLMLVFSGTVTVATAAATTSASWPYNLLSRMQLSANGQTDLWSCDGIDLFVHRHARFPAYQELVDIYPSQLGGGSAINPGTYSIYLSYEITPAMDDYSLIGSLYLQSAQTNISLTITQALNSALFSANPNNVTIAGNWSIEEVFYSVPRTPDGKLIIPDLSTLHGFNANITPFTNVGEVAVPLIKSAANLARLYVAVFAGPGVRLSAMPNALASNKVDAIKLQYGGNQNPIEYKMASSLLSINNDHYGTPPSYDRLVFDFVRENPIRDGVNMEGLTEFKVIPIVNSAVTVTAGTVRAVQETLFS